MGVTAPKAPGGLNPTQLTWTVNDNSAAQAALAKRSQALDSTIKTIDDKLANDRGLAAYPDATQRLERVKGSAQDGKSVIAEEQAIRQRLGTAAESGDQESSLPQATGLRFHHPFPRRERQGDHGRRAIPPGR